MAAAGGGLWGCTLFLSANAGISSPIESTFGALALLTIVPAVYTGLSAWLRRWTGFHPFLLAFGWILVELALTPLGLARGLLAGTQGENLLADWSGRLLGYVVKGLNEVEGIESEVRIQLGDQVVANRGDFSSCE